MFIDVHKHIWAPSACNLHCVEVVVVPAVHVDAVVCSMCVVHVRTHDLYMQVFAPSACGVSPFNLININDNLS